MPCSVCCCLCDFYPRPPRGGRRQFYATTDQKSLFLSTPSARRATSGSSDTISVELFLSTPSARRATRFARACACTVIISIHALREEGDLRHTAYSEHRLDDFYPRPPRGGRRHAGQDLSHVGGISIHALREEGDPPGLLFDAHPIGFLSTPSARRATHDSFGVIYFWNNFYPRPPRGGRRF